MKHTPTPWRAFDNAGSNMQGYSQSSGITGTDENRMQIVAGCFKDIGGEDQAAANAAFIVRAVNSHDQLVSLLTRVRDQVKQSEYWWMDCPDRGGFDLEAIEAALAAAGEQS